MTTHTSKQGESEARMSTPAPQRPLERHADYRIELRDDGWYLNNVKSPRQGMSIPAGRENTLLFTITAGTRSILEDVPVQLHIGLSGAAAALHTPVRLNTLLPDVLPSGSYLLTVYSSEKKLLGDMTGTLNVGKGGDEPPSSVSPRAAGVDDSSQGR
jgi:hypothetical protein